MNNLDKTNSHSKSLNYQMRPRPKVENPHTEVKHLTSFETFESIMASDQTTALKNIVQKHSDWLTETTIQDVHCDIVSVPCHEFDREQSKKTPFLQLITKQLRKSKDMFIIRPHMHCQTPSFKRFDITQLDQLQDVDQVSFMAYERLTSKDENWIFRRQLSDDPEKFVDENVLQVTQSSERSVENLKKMNFLEPLPEITMESTIFSLDFRFHWKAVSRFGVQIENCGMVEDLTNPEPHYLNVSSVVTPMLAFPFIDGFPIRGFSSPYLYYSFPGSTTPFHSEDGGCAAVNQNLGFESKIWVAVAERYALKMWNFLKQHNDSYVSRRDPCPAHFRKKADFIFVTQLKEWGIPFKVAIQQRGDIVITPTGVPHQVTSTGYTANESVNIIDPLWFHMTAEDCIFCPTREDCGYAHGHDWESLTGLDNFRIDDVKQRWLNHPECCGVTEPKHKVGDFNYRSCEECFPCEEIDLDPERKDDGGIQIHVFSGEMEPKFQEQAIQVEIQKECQDFSQSTKLVCPKCPASFRYEKTLAHHDQLVHELGRRKLEVRKCRLRQEAKTKTKTFRKPAATLPTDTSLIPNPDVLVPKRKRGRPSHSNTPNTNGAASLISNPDVLVPKRKRGRPPHAKPSNTNGAASLISSPNVPKRKRGRPPHVKPSNTNPPLELEKFIRRFITGADWDPRRGPGNKE